jgi:SAM-dependent methyltransferase
MIDTALPLWAVQILRCPRTGTRLQVQEEHLRTTEGAEVARIEQGVVRFPVHSADDSIAFYREVGGTHFHERSAVPFAMSTIDTPVYHGHVETLLPGDRDLVVVDIGGGDGRNASYCLARECRRVVVLDVVADALIRFRARVAEQNPNWLDRLLLIEADVRSVPLVSGCSEAVLAIEALCYLNEEYPAGLRECGRLLSSTGKILVSDRDYEGGLVLRLLYQGLEGLLELADKRSLWDGPSHRLVRSRCFTEEELVAICREAGLRPLQVRGMPLLSVLLGYLNGRDQLIGKDPGHLPALRKLLLSLSRDGAMRRCHVVVGQRMQA